MPRKALTICAAPGCPRLVPSGRCAEHARPAYGHTTSRQSRGYGAEHDRLRRQVAREEPCCPCGSTGPWQLDHIVNQKRGGLSVRENVRRLCLRCHREKTQHEANEGRA